MCRAFRLLAVLACLCLGTSGCFFVSIPLQFPPSDHQEVLLRPGTTRQKILVLDVDGTITSGPSDGNALFGSTSSTVNDVAEKLEKARKDKSVRAIILRIDSPGGGVTASDVVYRMLRDYREKSNVPIYTSMLDVAASGGYYIAMASDEIYAHPTTLTGSIGVIAFFPQLETLGNRIGVSVEAIKSGPNKDAGSPFRHMRPEERVILQEVIDNMYDRFVDVMIAGRPDLEEEDIRRLADGRIYTADQALDAGLIDGIMYMDEVVKHVRREIGASNARVIMYRKTNRSQSDSLYVRAQPIHTEESSPQTHVNATLNLLNVDLGGLLVPRQPVLHYLWVP